MSMLRVIKAALVVGLLSGCATTGVTEKDVITKVAFDKDCPESDVKVVDKTTGEGRGSYKVQACGQDYRYEHAGTVVYEEGQGPHQQ
jgi:predicted small secreted protein